MHEWDEIAYVKLKALEFLFIKLVAVHTTHAYDWILHSYVVHPRVHMIILIPSSPREHASLGFMSIV